ncbi:hypothetical protein F444_20505 [Phytophthora nicotianae P1976]|uniref:Phytotoxin PcF domain-containing protein n=1 Tax=Phytophthora nicotianae P1976 TaxID=1317066 RepID=A0A080Z4E3_PHYNI|nr:hypothetical protein F444_20505 [Phytophthora nicotianae P1976]
MDLKTCLHVVLFAVVATAAAAEDPLYKPPPYCDLSTGCQPLYPEANLAVSKACRDEGNTGNDFHICCVEKCGVTFAPNSVTK